MGEREQQEESRTAEHVDAELTAVSSKEDERQVEIHKPKPVHGWRDFVNEIGVIVIGVLIALGAEQVVESLHWSHVIHESEAAMRLELLRDDLPQAVTRDAITPCLLTQVDQLRRLGKPGQSGNEFHAAALRFSPPDRTWTSNALQASRSALAGHVAPADLLDWSLAYDLVPFLQRAADREQDALREVRRATFSRAVLSDPQAERLSDALDDLETADRTQQADSQSLLASASLAGIEITPGNRARLERQARETYGECAKASDLRALRRAFSDERLSNGDHARRF